MSSFPLFSGALATGPSPAAQTPVAAGSADREAIRRKAIEFEGIYLTQMLKPMFENVGAAEPFGGGFGEDVWRSMQVQEYGKAIAESGGMGLADAVTRELLHAQEARLGGQK